MATCDRLLHFEKPSPRSGGHATPEPGFRRAKSEQELQSKLNFPWLSIVTCDHAKIPILNVGIGVTVIGVVEDVEEVGFKLQLFVLAPHRRGFADREVPVLESRSVSIAVAGSIVPNRADGRLRKATRIEPLRYCVRVVHARARSRAANKVGHFLIRAGWQQIAGGVDQESPAGAEGRDSADLPSRDNVLRRA